MRFVYTFFVVKIVYTNSNVMKKDKNIIVRCSQKEIDRVLQMVEFFNAQTGANISASEAVRRMIDFCYESDHQTLEMLKKRSENL